MNPARHFTAAAAFAIITVGPKLQTVSLLERNTMSAYDPTTTPWQIDESAFPRGGTTAEQAAFLLNYAVLAPSSHNTQPWRFAVDRPDEVSVWIDKTRWLQVADADERELHISAGCAVENLVVAAAHFGLDTSVTYFPNPESEYFAAKVALRPAADPVPVPDSRWFGALTERRTNHRQYDDRPVPAEAVEALRACTDGLDVSLYTTDDREVHARIDEIIVRSDAVQFANPAFREELAYWIGQGVFGTQWLMTHLARFAVAHVNLGRPAARMDSGAMMSAPLFALITSGRNDRQSQIRAGRAFERMYLAATVHGLAIRPMSQILEVPESKAATVELLGLGDANPLQPFLLGYAPPEEKHTPRRPVSETML